MYNIYNKNVTNIFAYTTYTPSAHTIFTADTIVSIDVTNRKLNIIKDGYI